MKAIAYTQHGLPIEDSNALIDLELPTPEPGPRDLLVEVRAISVNPVDTKVRRGSPTETPRVLGWDAAGVVRAVGADVSLFKVGDEVFYAGDLTRQAATRSSRRSTSASSGASGPPRLRPGGRPAADLDHRLGAAVRPPRQPRRRRPGREPVDRRRGRRRRLHPHPTGPPAHRADGHRHRLARGNPRMGTGARRAPGDRSRPAAGAAAAEARHRLRRPGDEPDPHRPALSATDRGAAAAGSAGADRRPGAARRHAAQAQEPVAALGTDVHPLAVPDARHDPPARAAATGGGADRPGHAQDHPRRALWRHRRGQPAPRPMP